MVERSHRHQTIQLWQSLQQTTVCIMHGKQTTQLKNRVIGITQNIKVNISNPVGIGIEEETVDLHQDV